MDEENILGMYVPRVLLITGSSPDDSNVGGIWVRDICEIYPPDKLALVLLRQDSKHSPVRQVPCIDLQFTKVPSLREPISLISTSIRRHFELRNAIPRISRFADEHRPDIVLVILGGPISIKIAHLVAENLQLELITLVWDPPEYLNRPNRLDFFRVGHRLLMRQFYRSLQLSVRCAVMSDEMALDFSKYTETVVIHNGLPQRCVRDDTSEPDDTINIGFSGSIYAKHEFQALLDSLRLVDWKLAGKKVSLLVASSDFNINVQYPIDVHFVGWRPQDELVQMLSQCTVLYLPYSLDEQFKRVAKLSFPTKLSTYVAAHVPIFYHGPADSSVASFFYRYPIGATCHSNDPHEILTCLNQLVNNEHLRQTTQEVLERAYHEELSMEQFKRRMATLIGIEELAFLIDRKET